jgi:ankyrin repeat protein
MGAARLDDPDIVRNLLEKGLEVTASDKRGKTALMRSGPRVAKLLLDNGADFSVKDEDGMTPLMDVFYALWNVKFETGDVRRVGPSSIYDFRKGRIEYGSRALFADNRVKCKELAQLLLEHGADANARDNEGRTALSRVLEPLIEVEGDNITQSEEKGTAFAVKVVNGVVRVKRDPPADIVELLRAHGAKE